MKIPCDCLRDRTPLDTTERPLRFRTAENGTRGRVPSMIALTACYDLYHETEGSRPREPWRQRSMENGTRGPIGPIFHIGTSPCLKPAEL